tara:strand:+ start:2946 stop:3479 length:534 start_codon:yes stop_codon:yes gene_type:complete
MSTPTIPQHLIERLVSNAELVQRVVELRSALASAEDALVNALNGAVDSVAAPAETEAEATPAPAAKPTRKRSKVKKAVHHGADSNRPFHERDGEREMEFRGAQWSTAARALGIGRIERRYFPTGNRPISWFTAEEAALARMWIKEDNAKKATARAAKAAALTTTAPSEADDTDTNEK